MKRSSAPDVPTMAPDQAKPPSVVAMLTDRAWLLDQTSLILLFGGIAVSVLSFLLPGWLVFLGIIVIAKALIVLGLSILWWAGLVSFGQALFYGSGAYAAGLTSVFLGISEFFVLVPLDGLVALIIGYVLGFLLARYRDIFFANLNLAFSMLLFGILAKNEELGSTDGMHTAIPTSFGYDAPDALRLPITFTCAAAVAVIVFGGIHLFQRTTLGQMASAVKDSEIRVEYLGYSVRRACHTYITIAAGLAGLGGGIVALALGHVDPELVYWTTSGEFLFVTILSGTANVVAPLLGTIAFEIIRTYANQYSPFAWQIILGGSLLLTILFLPNGLWSLFGKIRHEKARTDE